MYYYLLEVQYLIVHCFVIGYRISVLELSKKCRTIPVNNLSGKFSQDRIFSINPTGNNVGGTTEWVYLGAFPSAPGSPFKICQEKNAEMGRF